MKKAQLTIPRLTLLLFIVGLFVAVSPNSALAALFQYTNTPVDASNVYVANTAYFGSTPQLGVFQGQLTTPDPVNLAGVRFWALAKSTDTEMRLRVRDSVTGFVDCQTEWFEPTVRVPTWGGGGSPNAQDIADEGAPLTLNFTGTACSITSSGNAQFIYGERSNNLGVQEFNQMYTARSVWNRDYTLYEFEDTPYPPDDTSTRIITVTPPHDSDGSNARATSTVFAIEATGYVNASEWVEGMYVRIFARNDAAIPTNSFAGPGFSSAGVDICNAMWDWLCPPSVDDDRSIFGAQTSWFQETWTMDIDAPGDFSFATTTDVQQIGRYTMTTQIMTPTVDLFGLTFRDTALVATTTNFLVATSTWYDQAHVEAQALVASLNAGANTYNCEINFSTLFGILDIGDCIKYMFAGSDGIITTYIKESIAGLTARAPWGYATRVYVIFTSPIATSTLPSIGADIPDGLPMAGSHVDFSPWAGTETAVATFAATPIPDAQGNPTDGSVLSNFLHWWNIMWGLVFALWIMKEIYGAYELGDFEDVGFVGGNAHGRLRKDVHGRKYQEWSTKDVKRAIDKGSPNKDGWGGGKGVIH